MQKLNVMLTPLIPDNTVNAFNNQYAVVNGGAGNDTLNGGGLLYGGEGDDVRLRWRTRSENISKRAAANDETTHAWRVAA